jgi:hypothetical protein
MNKDDIIKKYKIDFDSIPKHLSIKATLGLIESCYQDKNAQCLDYASKREDFKEALKDYFQFSVIERLQNSFIFQEYEILLKTLHYFNQFDFIIPKYQACTMMLASDCPKVKVTMLDYILKDENKLSIPKAQEIVTKGLNRNFEMNLDLFSCIEELLDVMVNDRNQKGNLLVLALEYYSKKSHLYEAIKEMNIKWEDNQIDLINTYINYLEDASGLHYPTIMSITKDLIKYDNEDNLYHYVINLNKKNSIGHTEEVNTNNMIELEKLRLDRILSISQEPKKLKL